MPDPSVPLKNRYFAAVLAWLVPGLGHWYQGRRGKAVLYFVCILSLFYGGLALGGWHVVYWRWVPISNSDQFCLSYTSQIFTGLAALPALLQATLLKYGHDPILWGYLAEPKQEVLNGVYQPFGKFVEMGYLYTMIAGLLNILAIFDALEGPAIPDEPPALAESGAQVPTGPTPVAAAVPQGTVTP